MNPARWEKIKGLLDVALEIPAAKREEFLNSACKGDDDLRGEVELLLSSFDDAESFMEQPAAREVASVIIKAETKNLEAGKCFGHYEIIRQIGAGGMGKVYLAKDKKLDRRVAVKILNEKFSRDESNLHRFIQEAKAASALNHQNILVIHEIDESGDTHYIVSEFVEGETLREIFKESAMKLPEVLDIAIQIANALTAAHAAHIVHRDIKPENIMIRRDGFMKILDFGLAKSIEQKTIGFEETTVRQNETAKGIILGTVNYMSPEQAKGEKIDARTDIFSFGVVLYEMLSGKQLFNRQSPAETISAILNYEPPIAKMLADIPPELQRIVRKSLAKDKEERYQTAKDLLIDLQNIKQESDFQDKLERTAEPRSEMRTQILDAAEKTGKEKQSSNAEIIVSQSKNRRLGYTIGLIALIFAIVSFGYWFFVNRNVKPIESIAILPFVNGSGDAGLDYLSDGVSESLIDRLSQLPQLKVIARSSSFKYRGENIDIQEVANKLGVQAIVMGKVVQRGDDLTIRVEMVDVRENKQLWGESFNRQASAFQTLQADISREIAENLRLRLTGAQVQQLSSQETANPQAYELLLKGFYFLRKGDAVNLKKSVEYYEQTIAVDPNYALAYAQLAEGYRFLLLYNNADPKEIMPKWEAAARKALELNENLADAHFAMAQFKRDVWEWQEAEREFKRAIELNPNLAKAHGGYTNLLSVLGRHEEAIAEVKRATALDPLSTFGNANYGRAYYRARRYDAAIEVLKKAIELEPNFPIGHLELGRGYAAKAMYREAIAEYQLSNKLGDVSYSLQIYLGAAYAKMGERERALGILKQLQTGNSYVSPAQLAILYAALDEREQAFASLKEAYAAHDLWLQNLGVDPNYDSLRSDPRFQDLLRRIGFPS